MPQYDDMNQGDGEAKPIPGTANTEFEAKAIVGQIKGESRRRLWTAKADFTANNYGTKAFKSGNTNGYFSALKKWHQNPKLNRAYQIRGRTQAHPALLKRLIK